MKHILYVEDNFQNYRLVMRMLTLDHSEYDVTRAEDGQTALRLAAELMPDLILMDINLPDIDGTEVTRRLKADEALRHIPVVALTANAMVGDREQYIEAGCDGYLRKPLSRDELREAVAKYTNGHASDASSPDPVREVRAGPLNAHTLSSLDLEL